MAGKKEEMVRIRLPIDRVNREDSVFVSVGDETFQIQRGVEVEVPDYVAAVLDNKYQREADSYSYLASLAH